MNKINNLFITKQQKQQKVLIGFCTANFPHPQGFSELLDRLPQAGCDIIEIGMPFSDPIADGPTIQRSNKVALGFHTNLDDIFATIRHWRQSNQKTPVVLMGYYNPVLQYGKDVFLQSCVQAGVDGLILVDLPPEESYNFSKKALQAGVAIIRLITPTTTQDRMAYVCKSLTQGFVYYVAVTGVTGVKKANQQAVAEHIAQLRKATKLPIAVGFGITNTAEAKSMAQAGDAIVVGSALIRAIEKDGVDGACAYIHELRQAIAPVSLS